MTWYGYQDPGKSVASDDRSVKPENSSPPGYSKEDYGQSWSSQEWKSGAAAHDRSGKPEKTSWDNIAEEMLLEFAESGHPTFRATTPLSRCILKSKGHGKLSIHFAADELTIETIFRIIISVNQLSIYGAVAAFCEEFENHQD